MATAGSLAIPAVVPRLWPGETFVCIASGPSLTDADVAYCRGKARVIVVNDNHRKAPWADVLYASDVPWWEHYDGVPSFAGLKFTVKKDLTVKPEWGVTQLRMGPDMGLSDDPGTLHTGLNSGYQAVNLAYLLGAARIVLLGYDAQKAEDGRGHWFGEHPRELVKKTHSPCVPYWRECFGTLVEPLKARGIEIVNCTRHTALTMFPRMSLEEAL